MGPGEKRRGDRPWAGAKQLPRHRRQGMRVSGTAAA